MAGRDPAPVVAASLAKAAARSYDEMRDEHTAQVRALMNRVSVDSSRPNGPPGSPDHPEDTRVRGRRPGLAMGEVR
ncbi:hypothetical protein ABZZ80_04050 [Streptomyces sp. NPDC006356]